MTLCGDARNRRVPTLQRDAAALCHVVRSAKSAKSIESLIIIKNRIHVMDPRHWMPLKYANFATL